MPLLLAVLDSISNGPQLYWHLLPGSIGTEPEYGHIEGCWATLEARDNFNSVLAPPVENRQQRDAKAKAK